MRRFDPRDRRWRQKGAAIGHYEDSEITEYRSVFDKLRMLEQLWVITD